MPWTKDRPRTTGELDFNLRGLFKIGDPDSLVEPLFPADLPKPKRPH